MTDTTRAVLFDEVGGPEVLQLKDVPIGEPAAGEIRIRVEAIGINRAESLFRYGLYYVQPSLPSARLGYEASGVVEAVGPGVTGFVPGDAVNTIPGFHLSEYGVYGEHAIVPARAVVHRVETVDPVTAAAVWVPYLTAYGTLIDVAGIQPGDTVVITAASSTVGLAAVQVANHLGAIPIATTRTTAKKTRLLEAGAAHVITTEDNDLIKQITELTGGRGADIALDALAGTTIGDLALAMRPGGTLFSYGALTGPPATMPIPNYPFSLNIRVFGVFEITRDQPRLNRAECFINAGLRSGAFTPIIDRILDLTEIVEAHRYLEAGTQVGKIVVTVER
jgi:NADPH:quinone reductase-like Zn-dependent oxidoreductase